MKRRQHAGFTLIELLVAIGVMALMTVLSWRSLDGMSRTQTQVQQHSDALLTVQAALDQWRSDLDAVVELPQTKSLDWDGRALRLTRGSSSAPGEGAWVVAWAVRNVAGSPQWLRWQSPPVRTRGEWQNAWNQAAQWAQNPGDDDKKYEVQVMPLAGWQIFYFRNDAWSNPLSSDSSPAATPGVPSSGTAGTATEGLAPDGIRLLLTLPDNSVLPGVITRDWVRPTLSGAKS